MDRLETLRNLMSDLLGVAPDQIGPSSRQDELPEWDSVSHLNLMLALEDTFGVRLDVDTIASLRSVDAILKFLETACPSR